MRAAVIATLLLGSTVLGQGLGIKTVDSKLQRLANMSADERYEEWKRLITAGRASVPTFVAMLKEKHGALRGLGASGLAQLGPLAADAVPQLMKFAADQSVHRPARLAAIAALGDIGPDASPAAPMLRKLLLSDQRIEVVTSAMALVKIDPQAKGLAEAVGRLLKKRGLNAPFVVWIAEQMGPAAALAGDAIARIAEHDTNGTRRRQAMRALRRIDPRSRRTIRVLVGRLADPKRVTRVDAAAILTEWGEVDDTVRMILLDGLEQREDNVARGHNEQIAVIAAAALLRLDKSNEKATARLRDSLRAATRVYQAETYEALTQLRALGRAAAPFAALVEEIAPESIPAVDGRAALALWAMTGDKARTLKLAKRALQGGYFEGCADVVRLVNKLENEKATSR